MSNHSIEHIFVLMHQGIVNDVIGSISVFLVGACDDTS